MRRAKVLLFLKNTALNTPNVYKKRAGEEVNLQSCLLLNWMFNWKIWSTSSKEGNLTMLTSLQELNLWKKSAGEEVNFQRCLLLSCMFKLKNLKCLSKESNLTRLTSLQELNLRKEKYWWRNQLAKLPSYKLNVQIEKFEVSLSKEGNLTCFTSLQNLNLRKEKRWWRR